MSLFGHFGLTRDHGVWPVPSAHVRPQDGDAVTPLQIGFWVVFGSIAIMFVGAGLAKFAAVMVTAYRRGRSGGSGMPDVAAYGSGQVPMQQIQIGEFIVDQQSVTVAARRDHVAHQRSWG